MIVTDNLELRPRTKEEALAAIDAMSPADREQVSPEWLARVTASEVAIPWLNGFTIVQRVTGKAVGSCGYKGPPEADSVVEIAYMLEPEFRERGYATEAARAMADFAFASDVKVVRAHTLPHENASTRVLTKCGFEMVGDVTDPEDGRVWRWELRQP